MIGDIIVMALAGTAPAHIATGGWVNDYAGAQCSARRQFGTSDKPLFLIVKPSPTSELIQLNLVRKNVLGSGAHEFEAHIAIGTAGHVRLRQLSFTDNGFDVQQVNLPPEQASLLASANRLSWSAAGVNGTFETGDLGPVMRSLAHCRDKMRNHWNIGNEVDRTLRSPVRAVRPVVSLFSGRDYPGQSNRQGDAGMTSVTVLIDERGQPRGCMLDATSGIASLDSKTCAIIRGRGRFKPAIGPDGKPVPSYIAQRVRWDFSE